MKNCDMNIVEFISPTKYTLSDSYSKGYSAPSPDGDFGGTNDLKFINYSTDSSGNYIMQFSRVLRTNDKYDTAINLDATNNLIIAWGPGTLSMHVDYKQTTFSISKINSGNPTDSTSTNTNTTLPPPDPTPVENEFDFFQFHGVILLILWTFFNFVGYIFARFLKHYTWWYWMHQAGSGITSFISIGVLAASIKYGKFNNNV
jgi:hypothetical protein